MTGLPRWRRAALVALGILGPVVALSGPRFPPFGRMLAASVLSLLLAPIVIIAPGRRPVRRAVARFGLYSAVLMASSVVAVWKSGSSPASSLLWQVVALCTSLLLLWIGVAIEREHGSAPPGRIPPWYLVAAGLGALGLTASVALDLGTYGLAAVIGPPMLVAIAAFLRRRRTLLRSGAAGQVLVLHTVNTLLVAALLLVTAPLARSGLGASFERIYGSEGCFVWTLCVVLLAAEGVLHPERTP